MQEQIEINREMLEELSDYLQLDSRRYDGGADE